MTRQIGHFRNEAAETRFAAAYDAALATWPTPPIHREIATRFGSTHVLRAGAARGTPIVLLHAVTVSSPMWAPTVAALGLHHPVYAIDAIGDVGRSVQTAPVRTGTDIAEWLDEVLAGLDLPLVHLVGLSYGGWIALNQGRRLPERVASITSTDPAGAICRAQVRFLLKILPDSICASIGRSDRALHRLLRILNDGVLPDQPLLELCVAGLRTFVGKQPFPSRFRDDDLSRIETPALVFFCDRSPVNDARRAARRVDDFIPNVRVEVIPDSGHMLPVAQPEVFTSRVLAFIGDVDACLKLNASVDIGSVEGWDDHA